MCSQFLRAQSGARLAHALGGELRGVVPVVLVEGVLHRDDGVVRRDFGVQLQQALPARRNAPASGSGVSSKGTGGSAG